MTPPRVVVDSNVVISAFLFGGPPRRVLDRALTGDVECFTSLPVLDEIRGVLQRPKFGLSPAQALALVEEYRDLCRIVIPAERVRPVPAHPGDEMILACALAARATLIITGDAHLLNLGRCGTIRIISPADFLKQIESGSR
jgi:putative PIN family toxin of toxin-antitoxin system